MPRTYVRRERKRDEVRDFRVYRPWWIDPYWWIQGSSIEKMVMAELARRGIYFQHTPQTNPLPWFSWMYEPGKDPSKWEADFLFPQFKIWLEIQGSYFHSLPGQIETDALRFAYIEAVGWKPIAWWEFDIRSRLPELFAQVPEFWAPNVAVNDKARKKYGVTKGLSFYEGGDGIDHLAGLRKALANRRKPKQMKFRRRVPGQRQEK